MRIVIGADTYPPDVNGAANFAHRLAVGLAGRGHDVHVICPAAQDAGSGHDGPTIHRLPSYGTPFHPSFRVCVPWRIRGAAARLLDRIAPDVVHVQSHFGVGRTLAAAASRTGVPLLATNHFMPDNLLGYAPLPRRLTAGIERLAWRDLLRVFRQAHTVTAPTPRAVQLLRDQGMDGTVLPVSCGLDLRRFAQPPATKADDTARVLFVGRLDAEKNIDVLLRALALQPEQPPVTAEIVGDGSRRAELEDLAREIGVADRVIFRGIVDDRELLDAYARCDLFCMPSTAELQSLATMEAMAAGKPVVAADAMALPHLVDVGVNGLLFPPGDVPALAAALGSVLGDPVTRRRMGDASREIIARHDIADTLDTFETLYQEAAGHSRIAHDGDRHGQPAHSGR